MALYLGKDKIAGTNTSSIIGDTLPVGAVIDYDGTEVPANWELVEDEAGNSTSNIANSIIILNSDLTADKVQKVLSGLEKNSETGEYSIKTAMFWEYPYQNDTDIATFIYIPAIQAITSIEDNIVGVFFKSPVIAGTSYQVTAAIQNPEDNPTTFASLEMRGIIEYVEDLGLSHNSAALAVSQGKVLNEKIEAITPDSILNIAGLHGQCKQITGDLDLNTGLSHLTGFYMGNNLTHAPNDSTDWFYIMHLCHNELYKMQIAYSVTDLSQNYMRKEINGVWSNWARIDHKEISFVLGSTTYRATKGTTWLEWINSGYNTVGASSSNNRITWISGTSQYYIQLQENDCDGTYDGQFVTPRDTIISGYTYPLFNERV